MTQLQSVKLRIGLDFKMKLDLILLSQDKAVM